MRCLATLLVWVSLVSLAASQPDTPPVGDSRIAGRILTEAGAGIEGAVVWAILFTGEPQATARYSATTGPDGGYVIDRLPAGRYNMFAEKPGYTNMLVQQNRISGGRSVDLDPVGAATGIDLVLRRTGSITGRVSRPDGTSVQGARVVTQIRLPNGRMLGTGEGARTDANGRYRLDDVPPGTYAVTAIYNVLQEMMGKAVPDEYQNWAHTFHPASAEFERATPITIKGGERLENIDIALQPEHRYRVSGMLSAERGSTLRNMQVEYAAAKGISGVLTDVGDDGQFTIGGVSGAVTLLGTAETENGTLIGLTQVNVTSSLDNVRVALGAPARVRGRVRFEGAPPPERVLKVQLATRWFRPRPNDEDPDAVPVAADGQFTIGNVIGERRVTVIGLMPQWEVKEVRRGGRVLPDSRLALAAGELVDDIEIIIARRQ